MRLEAPLMSFGGPQVDSIGPTMDFPGTSLLCGLFANALGWHHRDADRTQRLQDRLRVAARADLPGQTLTDYQTADLGQAFLIDTGWTTRHEREDRVSGASSRTGTHIRLRDYLVDSIYTVAISLVGEEQPDINALAAALRSPARPLFIGRKTCIPAAPMFLDRVRAASLHQALSDTTRHPRAASGPLRAWWPADASRLDEQQQHVADLRDWKNNVHSGRRRVCAGTVDPPEAA